MPSGWVLYLNIFWAMPFVRVYVFELFFGRCLSGPGYSGLAKARLLLRNEPSPSYPYRVCFILIWAMPFVRVYVFELLLGRCLAGPGFFGLAMLGYCCAMN